MSDFTPSNNPLPLSHHHSTPLRHPPNYLPAHTLPLYP